MTVFINGKKVVSEKKQNKEASQVLEELKELATLREQNKWLKVAVRKLLKKYDDKEALELLGEEIIREIYPKPEITEPTFRKV